MTRDAQSDFLSVKHAHVRNAYNAKINIHHEQSLPIYLGLQHEELKK